MAAPMALRALQNGQFLSNLSRHILPGSFVAGTHLNQIRWKNNHSKRIKAAKTSTKEATKWVSAAEKLSAKSARVYTKSHKYEGRVPVDDVYMICQYPRDQYSFSDALKMHREYASPEMTDNRDGLVHLDMWLNFRTKKKTKFMGNVNSSVVLPHNFDDGQVNRVIVFTKSEEEKERLLELGATAAGFGDLIRDIGSGQLGPEDYDYAVCGAEIISEIAPLRKFMKELFPSKGRGTVSEDLEMAMIRFKEGKQYLSEKEGEGATGKMHLILGNLTMEDNQLKENFQAYIDAINQHKTAAVSGQFISRAVIRCPPSTEKFDIKKEELVSQTKKGSSEKESAATVEEDTSTVAASAAV